MLFGKLCFSFITSSIFTSCIKIYCIWATCQIAFSWTKYFVPSHSTVLLYLIKTQIKMFIKISKATGVVILWVSLRWRHNGCDSVSNHQPHDCLLNRLCRRRSKKTLKLRVTGLCVENSPGTDEFSKEMASNAENVSIWWHHHVTLPITPGTHSSLQWRHNDHGGVSNHQPHNCLLHRLLWRRSKKTSKFCITGLCEGNSLVTGEFPAIRASIAENVWWLPYMGITSQTSYELIIQNVYILH